MPSPLLRRLRAIVFRARHEAELDEELQYHLDREVERLVATGMTAAEARRVAARGFGSTARHKEDVRSAWQWQWVEAVRQDVAFAIRSFRREPTLVLTVMVTIGLGVAINGAAFSLFNAYVLRPSPVRDPGSLYAVVWDSKQGAGNRFDPDRFRELGRQPVVAEALGYRDLYTRYEGNAVAGQFVSGNFFPMLGVGPVLGRTIQPSDDAAPGAGPVAVLNHRFWSTAFAKDSGVVGRVLRIRGVPLTVIGVAPEGFDGLDDAPPDFWVPLTMHAAVENRPDGAGSAVSVVARFRRDVGPDQAKAALEHWLRLATANQPEPTRVTQVRIESRKTPNPISTEMLLALLPIVGAFGLVLLTACANVAGVMVARGVARQREIGIRLAVGADRRRLIRQLVTESLLLAVPSALAAILLVRILVGGSIQILMATVPAAFRAQLRMTSLDADTRVYFFMVAASVGAALFFGLLPALQATRPGVVRAIRGEFSADVRPARLRRALVVGQITVAALLLITTGVLIQASNRIERIDLGFSPDRLVVLQVPDQARDRVVDRLERMPAVQSLASMSTVPLIGASRGVGIQIAPGAPLQGALTTSVSPEFFGVLGVELRAGRSFTLDEARAGAPVAIISEGLARRLGGVGVDQTLLVVEPRRAGGSGAVGSRPAAGVEESGTRTVRVIGISADVATGWLGRESHGATILSPTTTQDPASRLVLKLADASVEGRRALERNLTEAEAGTVDDIWAMSEIVDLAIYPFRLASWIAMAIGVVALLLTLTGVYGVLAFLVAQRTREIGVRIALGASQRRVVAMVLGESARLGSVGIGIGLVLAIGVAAVGTTIVGAMDVFEPVAFLGGIATVGAAILAGALIPSRRAARVEPLEAIRSD